MLLLRHPPSTFFRLSSFYFFFFATLGALVPYWSVYLKSLGFNAAEIGILMAILMASKVIAPYLLGWLADHFAQRLKIIQLAFLLTIIVFLGVFQAQTFIWFVLILGVFGFFWNASLPLFEALALNHLGDRLNRYSHIRLWGSVGFILLVVSLPPLIEGDHIARLPYILLGLLLFTGVTTFFIQDRGSSEISGNLSHMSEIIRSPMVLAFLAACTLQGVSHGAYYTFFSIYMDEHGYSRQFTGWMWGLGVLAEVGLFLFMHQLLSRFGACKLFAVALLLTTLRWIMLAYWVDQTSLLVISQLLHAASFGMFHAAAINLVHRFFPGKFQSRGQALYSGLSFGLGGATGNLLSGYGWESLGSTLTFLGSAGSAMIATVLALFFVRRRFLPASLDSQTVSRKPLGV